MIGSIGGRVAGPILGAYAAAKHGLVGMTGSPRAELASSGIKVFLIEPGTEATPIWSRGSAAGAELVAPPEVLERYASMLSTARDMARHGTEKGLPPAAVAEVIRATLTERNPPPRQVGGRDAKIMAAMVRLLPFRVLHLVLGSRALRGTARPTQPGQANSGYDVA